MTTACHGMLRTVGAGMALMTGTLDAGAEESDGAVSARVPETEVLGSGWWERWEKVRSGWSTNGVSFDFSYTGELWGNIAGGRRTGVVYNGSLVMVSDVEFEPLLQWRGARLRAVGIVPHGESVSAQLVGDLQTVSNLDTFRDGPMLLELWLEQAWMDDAWSVRAGLLLADVEFAGSDAGELWLNSAFGWPAGISLNTRHTGPAYFRPAAGARVRWSPDGSWEIAAGVYDGDTFDGDPWEDDGPDFDLTADGGAFGITEASWRWVEGDTTSGQRTRARFWGGAWGHTADHVAPLNPALSSPHGGLYAGAERHWYCTADAASPRCSAYARVGWSPDERSVADWCSDLGWRVNGVVGSRDALGLGLAWVHLSDAFRAAESEAGRSWRPRRGELVLECTWRFEVTSRWMVQPDYQWVISAGGRGEIADAHVFGVRSSLRF